MKTVFALLSVLAAAVASPLASRQVDVPFGIVSPKFNATIDKTAPFNFTLAPNREAKESTSSAAVYFVRGWNSTDTNSLEGIEIGTDLVANTTIAGTHIPVYSYNLTPDYVFPGPFPGQFSIVVVEKYNGFGGTDGRAVWTQFVNTA